MTPSAQVSDRTCHGAVVLQAEPPAYPRAMQAIHWTTVALLVCAYVAAWMIDGASSRDQAAWLVMLHRSFGVTILLITATRLVIRRRTRIPPLPADLPAVQRIAAKFSVVLLYGLLITQPLLGLIASLLHGDHVVLFGRIELPAQVPVDRPLAHQIFLLHGWTALLLLVLIGLHAAAALYHHFIRRDAVLAGMLPGARPSTVAARRGVS
jgi:cytochrome b561